MDITYNRAPTAIFSLKISAMAKLIYERMYVISKEGTQVIFFKKYEYASFFNVEKKTIIRAVNELIENRLLEVTKPAKRIPFDQTKYYLVKEPKIEQKTAESVDSVHGVEVTPSTVQELPYRECKNDTLTECKNDTIESVEIIPCQSVKVTPCSLDKISKDYISKDKVREAKRSASASLSYSFDDIFVLFTQKANELKKDHLAIERMYLPTIAEKFFNFWSKKKFKFNLGLDGNITKWLLDECAHIESNLLRDTKSEKLTEQQQRANKTNEWIDREAELKGITPEEVRQQFLDYYHAAINGPTDEQKLLSDFLGVSVNKLTHNQGVVINEH